MTESKREAAHTPADDADRQVLRALIKVCEDTEDKYHGSANDFERGRAFEAKHIRRGVSTWYQDTFCGQTHMGEPVFARAPDLAAEVERLQRRVEELKAALSALVRHHDEPLTVAAPIGPEGFVKLTREAWATARAALASTEGGAK